MINIEGLLKSFLSMILCHIKALKAVPKPQNLLIFLGVALNTKFKVLAKFYNPFKLNSYILYLT